MVSACDHLETNQSQVQVVSTQPKTLESCRFSESRSQSCIATDPTEITTATVQPDRYWNDAVIVRGGELPSSSKGADSVVQPSFIKYLPAPWNEMGLQPAIHALPPTVSILQGEFYKAAFKCFVENVSRECPQVDLSTIATPPLSMDKTSREWLNDFLEKSLEFLALNDEERRKFVQRVYYMMTSNSGSELYVRLPFISHVVIAGDACPAVQEVRDLVLPKHNAEDYIFDMNRYLSERFPEPLQAFLRDRLIPVFLHSGRCENSIAFHKDAGFAEVYQVDFPRGGPRNAQYLVRNPLTDEYRFVIPNLIGTDAIEQLRHKLGAVGLTGSCTHVLHEEQAPLVCWNERAMTLDWSKINHAVIGMKNALRWVLRRSGDWHCETLSVDGAEIDLLTNAETGSSFINARYVHGDKMLKLVEELYDRGIRRFTHVGTSGSLMEGAQIGDILVPTTVRTASGDLHQIPNVFAQDPTRLKTVDARIFHNVQHGSVAALLEETRQVLDSKKESGCMSLDIEVQYLAPFFNRHPDATLEQVLIASDIPYSPEYGYDKHGATISIVVESLAEIANQLVAPLGQKSP
jgi:hypothetical protein